MLGNSTNVMRAPFGVKGGRDILFRNNTISGDLPSLAFAMRLSREGDNLQNENIEMYNNIWVDQTGSMGATGSSSTTDFSDTPPGDTSSFTLLNNLYFNGNAPIPVDGSELVNYTDDSQAVLFDPNLAEPVNITLPRWNESGGSFGQELQTIDAVFTALVETYCMPESSSPAVDKGYDIQAPAEDILGRPRNVGLASDIGACEYNPNSEGGDGSEGNGGNGGGSNSGGDEPVVSVPPTLHLLLGH
jgi:hypothetical protein